MKIANRHIGPGHPCYIVAEMSANHLGDYHHAHEIVRRAAAAGANAIKLQCYKPETLTLDCDRQEFQIAEVPWAGRTLYELYQEAYTPWEWFPDLADFAHSLGMDCFASVFCQESVDYCDGLGFPAFKIASFELTDLPLIRYAASKGKPMILSTGMADFREMESACNAASDSPDIALLHCISSYPATPESANLLAMQDMIRHPIVPFACNIGISDHTLGIAVPVAAVTLGACIIEKHICLRRSDGGTDAGFSLEPQEFSAMVDAVRVAEAALGEVHYGPTESEKPNLHFRRSLFVVEDMASGEKFSSKNVRSIRPADGLHPQYYECVLGKLAARDIKRGTPLQFNMIRGNKCTK